MSSKHSFLLPSLLLFTGFFSIQFFNTNFQDRLYFYVFICILSVIIMSAKLFLYNFYSISKALKLQKTNYLICNLLFFVINIWTLIQAISTFRNTNSPLDFFWFVMIFAGTFVLQNFINSDNDLLVKSFCVGAIYVMLWQIINFRIDSVLVFGIFGLISLATEIVHTYMVQKLNFAKK